MGTDGSISFSKGQSVCQYFLLLGLPVTAFKQLQEDPLRPPDNRKDQVHLPAPVVKADIIQPPERADIAFRYAG